VYRLLLLTHEWLVGPTSTLLHVEHCGLQW